MRFFIIVSVVFCLVLGSAGFVSSALAFEPEDFNYTFAPITTNLRDVSGSGTQLHLNDDDVTRVAVQIGFTFSFYGDDYTEVNVSSNGFLTFNLDRDDGCCRGQSLPDLLSPNNLIAGFWEDLNPDELGSNIRYETLGTPGSREFVVGFYNVPHFRGPMVTFEMILHEGTNKIELQYGLAESDISRDVQETSVGIENGDGTIGLQIARGSDVSFANEGFLLDPNLQIAVPINIRPSACPNNSLWLHGHSWFHRKRLRVAISGSKFPIGDIDLGTVTLEGVPPIEHRIKDIYMRERVTHNGSNGNHFDYCSNKYRDDIEDLVLTFDRFKVLEALKTNKTELTFEDGEATTLTLKGKLRDENGGDDIIGEDLVVIRSWHKK